MIVENGKGPSHGSAGLAGLSGAFYLSGDVPALMPGTVYKATKVDPGKGALRWQRRGFQKRTAETRWFRATESDVIADGGFARQC